MATHSNPSDQLAEEDSLHLHSHLDLQLRLHEIEGWPAQLQHITARDILKALPGPSLFHLPGDDPRPLFVSILLHGNETVGLEAVQRFLYEYGDRQLPRAMSVFVGNVSAAAAGVRTLQHQCDFNRVWPGSELPECCEQKLMREVVSKMVERKVAMSIDLHNNSGRNPLYSCVCSLNVEHVRLAAMFSPQVLYFQRPKGVQTQAFAQFCPSITCECGPIGDRQGVQAAVDLLHRAINSREISNAPLSHIGDHHPDDTASDMDGSLGHVELFHSVATWKITAADCIRFRPLKELNSREARVEDQLSEQRDVVLRSDLDSLNFCKVNAGTVLGQVSASGWQTVQVIDEAGREVTNDFLMQCNGQLQLARAVIPSMLTCNAAAIALDCVGYFMEPFELEKLLSSGA